MFVIAKVAQNVDNIKVLAHFFERVYVYNTKFGSCVDKGLVGRAKCNHICCATCCVVFILLVDIVKRVIKVVCG